ncbi:MAG: hypothetical protein ABH837_02945 [bacterium]
MIPILSVFQQLFLSLGYREQIASPIFPCPDLTTLFVSATISVFKRDLLAGKLDKAFVIQPCLRTQNLRLVIDINFDPEYLSSFTMIGIICPPNEFIAKDCVPTFFNAFPDLPSKILVRSSKAIENDLSKQLDQHYRIEYDTRNPSYYKWHYGEKSLYGVGVTFAIEQPDGEFLDIGNLVLVYKDGVLNAVELGFGLETFAARSTGKGSPFATSQEYIHMGLGLSPADKCLGDCLIVALKLFENGVMPGTGKASSVMRKALRSACFLAIRDFGDSADEEIGGFACRISTNLSWIGLVEKTYKEVKGAVDAFVHEVGHIQRHTSGSYLNKKIAEYRLRYGVPEQF